MVVAKPGGEPVQKFCSVPGVVAVLEAAIQAEVWRKYGARYCIPIRIARNGVDAILEASISLEGSFPGREEILAAMVLRS